MKNHHLSHWFFRFFTKVFDLIWLNILFILCSLPIITIGVSISALYSVSLKMIRQQDTYITQDFFQAFRQNLKQGILLQIIFSMFALLAVFDFYVMWNIMQYGVIYKWAFGVMVIVSVLFLMASMYIFPLLAQFNNSVKGYLYSAVVLSIKHFPYTIMFLLLTALPVAAALFIEKAAEWEIFLFLMIGFSGIVYLFSLFFNVIFKNYIDKTIV